MNNYVSLFSKIDRTASPINKISIDDGLNLIKTSANNNLILLSRQHNKNAETTFENGVYYIDYDEYNNVLKYDYIKNQLNHLLINSSNDIVYFSTKYQSDIIKNNLNYLGIKYTSAIQIADFYSFFEYKKDKIAFVSLVWGGFDSLKQEKSGIKGEFKLVLRNLYTFVKSTKIPVVTWNAEFNNKRSLKNISNLSGYMYMDIDDFSSMSEEEVFNILTDDGLPFIKSVWKSFGGNGLGFLVNIEGLTIENFKWNWLNICKKFESLGVKVDKATKDITRINVLSLDPNLFIRDNCIPLQSINDSPEDQVEIKINPLKDELKKDIIEQIFNGLYYDDSFYNESENRLSYRFYQVLFSKLNHVGILLEDSLSYLKNNINDYPKIKDNPKYTISDIESIAKSQYDAYHNQFGTVTIEKKQYASDDYIIIDLFKQYEGDVQLKLNDLFEQSLKKEEGDINAALIYFALISKRTGILIKDVNTFLDKKFGYNPETLINIKKIYNNPKYQFGLRTKLKDSALYEKRNKAISKWESEGKKLIFQDEKISTEIEIKNLESCYNKTFKTSKITEKNIIILTKNYFKECNSFNISLKQALDYLKDNCDFHSIERYANYYGKEIYEYYKPYKGIRVISVAEASKKKINSITYLESHQKLSDLNLKIEDNTILWADTNMGKTTWACSVLSGKRIILVPTVGALKSIEEKYNCASYYESNKNVSPENDLIVCTYSSAPKLFTLIQQWQGGLSNYTLIVDEQHNFAVSSAKNYRNSELNFVMDNLNYFNKRIFMTGTLFPVEHPLIQDLKIHRVKWKEQPKKNAQIIWCNDKYKSVEKNLIRGKKNIIYLQDKRMHKQLGKLVDYLKQKKWNNIYLLNANEKNEPHFKDLIKTEYLAKDAEIIITTSVTVEAINILDLDVETVHFLTFENPRLMEQMVNRMRKQLPSNIFIYKKIKEKEENIDSFDIISLQGDLINQSLNLIRFLSKPKQKKSDSYDQVAAQKLFANQIFEKSSLFRVKNNSRDWDVDYLAIANKIFTNETNYCKNNFDYFKSVLEEYGWFFKEDMFIEEKMTKVETDSFKNKKEIIEREMLEYSLEVLEKVSDKSLQELKNEVENKSAFINCKYPDLEWSIRIKILKLSKYMNFEESCKVLKDWITIHNSSEKIFECIMREVAVKIAKISGIFDTDLNLNSKFSQSILELYFKEKDKNLLYKKYEIVEFFNRRKKLNVNLKDVDGEKYANIILAKYFEVIPVLNGTEIYFKFGGLNVANDLSCFTKEFYDWAEVAHKNGETYTSEELTDIVNKIRKKLPFLGKIILKSKDVIKLLNDYVTIKKTAKRLKGNIKTGYKIEELEPKLTKNYVIKINQEVFYTNYLTLQNESTIQIKPKVKMQNIEEKQSLKIKNISYGF